MPLAAQAARAAASKYAPWCSCMHAMFRPGILDSFQPRLISILSMGKRKPVSILKRSQQGVAGGHSNKRKADSAGVHEQHQKPRKQARKQPLDSTSAAGGSAGASRQEQQHRQPRQQEPAGLRPTSPVHSQAAYAVRRLLEADASKRGGVTLKSLTLAPHIAAKKVPRCRSCLVPLPDAPWLLSSLYFPFIVLMMMMHIEGCREPGLSHTRRRL